MPSVAPRTILLVGLSLATPLLGTANATLLWDGDASKGTAVFGNLQPVNGTITVVDDPTYGKVFKIVCNDNGNTKARSEVSRMAGITLSNGGDYYIGWRSKWGPLPAQAGKWQVLSQIHLDGPGSVGGPVPFGLSVPGDGKMHFNAQDPNGRSSSMWDHAFPVDSWHKYVVHTKMGETLATGVCEIWFDGVKQTLTNGQQNIPCAMAHANAGSYWKWGVYRSGSGGPIGQSVHYLQRPMFGTTYEDVAEIDAGTGGSDAGGGAPADAAADGSTASPDGAAGGESGSGGSGGGGAAGASGEGTGGTPNPPPSSDAGVSPPTTPAASGCGCRTAPGDEPAAAPVLLLLLGVGAVIRRRGQRS
jgi:MYXO-CTERM domain-containing protein